MPFRSDIIALISFFARLSHLISSYVHGNTTSPTPRYLIMQDVQVSNDTSISVCSHLALFTCLPPSLETFAQRYPHITPDIHLDRSLNRCKFCDLITTHLTNTDASVQTYGDLDEQVRTQIDLLLGQINERVETGRLNTVGVSRGTYVESTESTMTEANQAWPQFWTIWGLEGIEADGEGQIIRGSFEPDLVRMPDVPQRTAREGKRKFKQELRDDRGLKKRKGT